MNPMKSIFRKLQQCREFLQGITGQEKTVSGGEPNVARKDGPYRRQKLAPFNDKKTVHKKTPSKK